MTKILSEKSGLIPVIEAYKISNFSRALDLHKKAKISQQEAGISKQIKAEICNQLALNNLLLHKYAEAINFVEPTLIMQAKDGFPLPIEKAKIIAGISNLYLGNFDAALTFLSFTSNNQAFAPFYFYYLLSLIYSKKFENFDALNAFLKQNNVSFNTLPFNKQNYIIAAYFIVSGENKDALKALKKIKPESHIQTRNLNFLLHFLSDNKTKVQSNGLKPLYKFLGKFELSTEEKVYLNKLSEFKDYFNQQYAFKDIQKINDCIKKLCTQAIPLDKYVFSQIMNSTQFKEVKKYIIINQLSALINLKDVNVNNEIELLIYNYKSVLLDFFEFIFLYFKYQTYTKKNKIQPFFQTINAWGRIHDNKLSSDLKEIVAIETVKALIYSNNFQDSGQCFKEFERSVLYNPNLLGCSIYKYVMILFLSNGDPITEMRKIILHPKFSDHYEFASFIVKDYFSSNFMALEDFFYDQEMTRRSLKSNIPIFIKSICQPLDLDQKKKGTLRLYQDGFKYLELCLEKNIMIEEQITNEFYTSLNERILFFKQNKPGAEYYDLYISVNKEKLVKRIKKIISTLDPVSLSALIHEKFTFDDHLLLFESYFSVLINLDLKKKQRINAILMLIENFYNEISVHNPKLLDNNLYLKWEFLPELAKWMLKAKKQSIKPDLVIWFCTGYFIAEIENYPNPLYQHEVLSYINIFTKYKATHNQIGDLTDKYKFIIDKILKNFYKYKTQFLDEIIKLTINHFPEFKLPDFYEEIIKIYPGINSRNNQEIYTVCGEYIQKGKIDEWITFMEYLNNSSYTINIYQVLYVPLTWYLDNSKSGYEKELSELFNKITDLTDCKSNVYRAIYLLQAWIIFAKEPEYKKTVFEFCLHASQQLLFKEYSGDNAKFICDFLIWGMSDKDLIKSNLLKVKISVDYLHRYLIKRKNKKIKDLITNLNKEFNLDQIKETSLQMNLLF